MHVFNVVRMPCGNISLGVRYVLVHCVTYLGVHVVPGSMQPPRNVHVTDSTCYLPGRT